MSNFTTGGPVIQQYSSTGTLLATYYLPFADTNTLSWTKEGEVVTLVDSTIVRGELNKGFLPCLKCSWPVYNDVSNPNVGTTNGKTPSFVYLMSLLSLPLGQLKVAQNENSPFFTCIVKTMPEINLLKQRIATSVSIEFLGTTLYTSAVLV